MSKKDSLQGKNRCVDCGRFAPWWFLNAWTQPDSEDGPEYTEYTCRDKEECKRAQERRRRGFRTA